MNQPRTPRLKPFLDSAPPGALVEAAWLKARKIDRKSIHNYVQRGWLEPLTRGVYRRPVHRNMAKAPHKEWRIQLLSIQHLLGYDVHLGGVSALNQHGHVHYLRTSTGEKLFVYGAAPKWLGRLPSDFVFETRSRKLFEDPRLGVENADDKDTINDSAQDAPETWRLKLSTAERAILEALDELPNEESFHNLDMIFEGMVNLRPKLLNKCLKNCRSIKVKRLFFVFAEKHGHAWLKHIDKEKVELGSGPRALVKGGKYHPDYHISVPKEFATPASLQDADNV